MTLLQQIGDMIGRKFAKIGTIEQAMEAFDARIAALEGGDAGGDDTGGEDNGDNSGSNNTGGNIGEEEIPAELLQRDGWIEKGMGVEHSVSFVMPTEDRCSLMQNYFCYGVGFVPRSNTFVFFSDQYVTELDYMPTSEYAAVLRPNMDEIISNMSRWSLPVESDYRVYFAVRYNGSHEPIASRYYTTRALLEAAQNGDVIYLAYDGTQTAEEYYASLATT